MGKVITVDFGSNKKTSVLKYQADPTNVGTCAGCQTFGSLDNHICNDCVQLFGRKVGPIFVAIRKDPKLAKKCFNYLEKDFAKKRFIEWFGDPREA